jgi:hypothetical protein
MALRKYTRSSIFDPLSQIYGYCRRYVVRGFQERKRFSYYKRTMEGNGAFLAVVAFRRINNLRII